MTLNESSDAEIIRNNRDHCLMYRSHQIYKRKEQLLQVKDSLKVCHLEVCKAGVPFKPWRVRKEKADGWGKWCLRLTFVSCAGVKLFRQSDFEPQGGFGSHVCATLAVHTEQFNSRIETREI